MRVAIIAALLCLLTACSPTPTPSPTPSSPAPLWSESIVIAQAQQADAPVLWARDTVTAAWIGADDAGVHQDARRIVNGALEAPVVLPLPPVHPYAQRSAFAADSNLHLLWLDESDDGTNRLFSAVLLPDLTVYRGATPVSNAPTTCYDIAPTADGSVWAAWSGGVLVEPSVTFQQIDADGRPLEPLDSIPNAIVPALAWADTGVLFAFWLNGDTGELVRARLENGAAVDARAVTMGVRLEQGDRLVALHAALDSTGAYVVWNISRADDSDETWLAHGGLSADSWAQPQPFTVDGTVLAWSVPLGGQHDPLPVVAQNGNELNVVYLHAGEVTDYETIAPLDGRLLGEPGLYENARGGLVAAWAAPTNEGYAELTIATRVDV